MHFSTAWQDTSAAIPVPPVAPVVTASFAPVAEIAPPPSSRRRSRDGP
ncbi:hypothetical protein NKH18_42650 [Streptomyces sp. M10(2022)]